MFHNAGPRESPAQRARIGRVARVRERGERANLGRVAQVRVLVLDANLGSGIFSAGLGSPGSADLSPSILTRFLQFQFRAGRSDGGCSTSIPPVLERSSGGD